MSGPEHYAQAERLLGAMVNESVSEVGMPHYESTDGGGGYDYSYLLAAQVHATLALAAATWDIGSSVAQDEPLHRDEWSKATS